MSKLMTEIDLFSPMPEGVRGIRTMHTWVEADPRIKNGARVTLKGDDPTVWEIVKVYGDRELDEISNYGWDNNNYDKHAPLMEKS